MLPLGSVVRLNGSSLEAKLLIIGRLPLRVENGVKGYFDYVACPHAIGATESRFFYFNEDDILEVFFNGYVDDIEKEYNLINENTRTKLNLPKLESK